VQNLTTRDRLSACAGGVIEKGVGIRVTAGVRCGQKSFCDRSIYSIVLAEEMARFQQHFWPHQISLDCFMPQ
jgi:hypothetical protein